MEINFNQLWKKDLGLIYKEASIDKGKQAKVDISVGINSGYNVPQTCRKVQEKVKTSIETMTGLEVVDVNVRVSSVALPKNE